MNAEEKTRYFQELTLNLQREGFAVKPETEEGLLPVELDGQRLCLARASGAVRYRREDAADEHRSAALDSVISIAKTTNVCLCKDSCGQSGRWTLIAPSRQHRQWRV